MKTILQTVFLFLSLSCAAQKEPQLNPCLTNKNSFDANIAETSHLASMIKTLDSGRVVHYTTIGPIFSDSTLELISIEFFEGDRPDLVYTIDFSTSGTRVSQTRKNDKHRKSYLASRRKWRYKKLVGKINKNFTC